MSVPVASGLTYDDLAAMPEPGVDGLRKELIDGELYVTPAPIRRHQDAVVVITAAFHTYLRLHGGKVYPAPTDVHLSERTVVEPDVVFLGTERAGRLEDPRYVDVKPDLVVEVSSPGHYGTPTTLAAGETLTCLAAPGFELAVTDVLA